MPGPAWDAQSLEKDHRSSRERLKGSTKEFLPPQPVAPHLYQGAQLKYLWSNTQHGDLMREVRVVCMPAVLQPYQHHGDMAPLTGVLEWKDTALQEGQAGDMKRWCRSLCQWPAGKGGDSTSLLHSGKTPYGVLHPLLGAEEVCGPVDMSAKKCHKDDYWNIFPV